MDKQYDVIFVGSGFASSFFLSSYLKNSKKSVRVLVLERGRNDSHAWQVENRRNSSIKPDDTFINSHPRKKWVYTPNFGGGSNCWWACTPRMLPNDFRINSLYGIGADWPLTYDDLEEYYYQAEVAMAISGPSEDSPFPRRLPYPQPPHLFSNPDKYLKAAYPTSFFQQPTARARVATANRPNCCANGVCHLCPINAKFTIQTEMGYLYKDPRVTLELESTVQSIEKIGNIASGVSYLKNGTLTKARGNLVVLGANALFNPHILLRSGIDHPLLGKYLNEQVSVSVLVDLNKLDNFQGSTSIVGHGYMLYDGHHRSQKAAGLIEAWNVPAIRTERKKWRQRLKLKVIFEDIPSTNNFVKISDEDPNKPETVYTGFSDYTQRGIDSLSEELQKILEPLPVERVVFNKEPLVTEAHILGTTVMGLNPQQSIVDKHLIHHQIRNLVILGSGVFPSCAPANPTLTISALSLWSAKHVVG